MPPDQPFVLVASGVHGLTITAANARARAEGIAVGASLADTRAAWPTVVSRPAEPERDQRALDLFARACGRYGPNRNIDCSDGVWIETTGVDHLFSGEANLLAHIDHWCRSQRIPARIALADTIGAAHALARFATRSDQRTAIADIGETRAALTDVPVEALRLDDKSVLLLKRLGLRHIGQLYDIDRTSLERRFRAKDDIAGVLLRLDQALGARAEPLVPLAEPPVMTAARHFTAPLISPEGIEAAAREVCDDLSAALAERDTGVRVFRLSLYRSDGTVADIAATTARATNDAAHMMRLLIEKLSSIDAGLGIDAIRLDAIKIAQRRAEQTKLADKIDTARADSPAELIDRLVNRFGASSVAMLTRRDSHIPERAQQAVPALAQLEKVEDADARGKDVATQRSRIGQYVPPWPYQKGPRRPSFMLPRPEPIRVLAGVPDGPPLRFTWRRVERRIVRAEGPERIAPEWWLALGEIKAANRLRPRDYYTIEDATGAAFWVFRHGLYAAPEGMDEGADGEDIDDDAALMLPAWFLHGVFA